MKPELQKQLIEKFPKIFAEVGSSPQESGMAFGLEISNGWYKLVYELCRDLQHHIDMNDKSQVVAAQVKTKFGGLRFYINGGTDEQYGAISFAESLSYSICEYCGSMEDVGQTRGWIITLCKKCAKKENKEIEKDRVKTDVLKDKEGKPTYYTEFPSQDKKKDDKEDE